MAIMISVNGVSKKPRRIYLVGSLMCILIYMSGCVSMAGYPERSGDVGAQLKQLDLYHDPNVFTKYDNLKNEQERRMWRDDVVFGRIRAIKLHFQVFQKTLNAERTNLNISSDFTVIGLNTAGTLIPSAATKTVLATLSGGLIGAKGSIEKNLYYEQTIPVLFSKMESMQKERLVTIQNGLRLDTTEYSLQQALVDVENYYMAGTIPGAIMGIAQTSGAESEKADDDLKSILRGKYEKDEAGDVLRTFYQTNSKNKAKLEEWIANDIWMQAWMDDNGTSKVSLPFFIRNRAFSEARTRAANDLDLGNFN